MPFRERCSDLLLSRTNPIADWFDRSAIERVAGGACRNAAGGRGDWKPPMICGRYVPENLAGRRSWNAAIPALLKAAQSRQAEVRDNAAKAVEKIDPDAARW